jgi:hypothetical protein
MLENSAQIEADVVLQTTELLLKGRLSTVDLLVKVACFVKEKY